jgi:hypothetical protein
MSPEAQYDHMRYQKAECILLRITIEIQALFGACCAACQISCSTSLQRPQG